MIEMGRRRRAGVGRRRGARVGRLRRAGVNRPRRARVGRRRRAGAIDGRAGLCRHALVELARTAAHDG
jgi:hypothetical protein